ncbi:Phosphotyrosyl phosphatase activator, partial [Myriangium duriaei CBS 260.36]
LKTLSLDSKITPEEPAKRINDGEDLAFFLRSRAFADIVTFIGQLNRAMFPQSMEDGEVRAWPTQSVHILQSPQVMRIKVLVQTLGTILKDTPPEEGPRRFGNVAFRTWYAKVEERLPKLLQQALPEDVWNHVEKDQADALKKELGSYFLGSLGSAERLDYGTGHELSFLAFLLSIWKLNGFAPSDSGQEERGIVVGVIEPYLELVRTLIKTYTLEPAGSHGVWGLDDHSFVPFIFGSAQVAPPVLPGAPIPTEGGLRDAVRPNQVVNEQAVRQLAGQNMYFAAVTFIYDVKKGPFWEHSPMLYDISGIEAGWAKINKGLVKMYRAEVLAKFPVVQHLRFGSLLGWEVDPDAVAAAPSVHAQSQPKTSQPHLSTAAYSSDIRTTRPMAGAGSTAAPWARPPPP